MNAIEYDTEIKSIAENLVSECMSETDNDQNEAEEMINDCRLHETIDGHQWVIYYAYNDDVLKYSDNNEAYQDVYGNEDLGALVAENGFDSAKTMMVFFAMYQDVQEQLENAFNEFNDTLEESCSN